MTNNSMAKSTKAVMKPSLIFLSDVLINMDCISTSTLTPITITTDCGDPTAATISIPIPIDNLFLDFKPVTFEHST
jgi:hypothetical protein